MRWPCGRYWKEQLRGLCAQLFLGQAQQHYGVSTGCLATSGTQEIFPAYNPLWNGEMLFFYTSYTHTIKKNEK